MYCENCRAEISRSAKYCPEYGNSTRRGQGLSAEIIETTEIKIGKSDFICCGCGDKSESGNSYYCSSCRCYIHGPCTKKTAVGLFFTPLWRACPKCGKNFKGAIL